MCRADESLDRRFVQEFYARPARPSFKQRCIVITSVLGFMLCSWTWWACRSDSQPSAAVRAISPRGQPMPSAAPPILTPLVQGLSRSFWITWKYTVNVDNSKAVGVVYRSIDDGVFAEVGRSLAGATSMPITTEDVGKKHCYYVITIIGQDAAPPSKPWCQTIVAVPQAEDVKIEPER